jgi:hypothetical protein
MAMHDFAAMPTLDLWYHRLNVDEVGDRFGADATSETRKRFARMIRKAETKNRLRALTKLTQLVDEAPPRQVPLRSCGPQGGWRWKRGDPRLGAVDGGA